jgi:hypothetical protein
MKWKSVVGGSRDLNYVTYRNLYLKRKLATFAQIVGTCLVQKSSRIKIRNALDAQKKKDQNY